MSSRLSLKPDLMIMFARNALARFANLCALAMICTQAAFSSSAFAILDRRFDRDASKRNAPPVDRIDALADATTTIHAVLEALNASSRSTPRHSCRVRGISHCDIAHSLTSLSRYRTWRPILCEGGPTDLYVHWYSVAIGTCSSSLSSRGVSHRSGLSLFSTVLPHFALRLIIAKYFER